MYYSETDMDKRRIRKQVEPSHDLQQQYFNDLGAQIKIKQNEKDKAKIEDDYINQAGIAERMRQVQLDSDKAKIKQDKNAQYFKDLQNQVKDNSDRKKMNSQMHGTENYASGGMLSEGMSQNRSELEKKEKQVLLKHELDQMIEEKLKLEQLAKDESLKYEKEMQEILEVYDRSELATKKIQKEKYLKMQQEFRDFQERIKLDLTKREKEIEKAVDKEKDERNELTENKCAQLQAAQYKLRNETYTGWDEQIEFRKQQKAREVNDLKDQASQIKVLNDMWDQEDDLKRAAKHEANKQYQRDLLEQIQANQKKKNCY